jgi:glycosyltransferase involved in cell wall biosynthesis
MKCSIVLTTCYRHELLDLTLASIFKQNPSFDTEVIVVNDGQSDEIFNVCKKYEGRIHYYFTNNKSYRNPAYAHNVGYLAARGDIIISQCDDIIHFSPNVVENLVNSLKPGTFLLTKTENWEYKDGLPIRYKADYCSIDKRPVPYFFCGAIRREDLYAVGGNDNDFVEPCYDDNWFADCIMNGEPKLKPEYSKNIITHHIFHGYPKDSHKNENTSKKLYMSKVANAKRTGIWESSSGSWPIEKQTIPKCMNFFWSSDKMSLLRYLTLKSFRVQNPDWKINLFSTASSNKNTWVTNELQDYGSYIGEDYSDKIAELNINQIDWESPILDVSPAHACDLMQWEILSTVGGFYSDMDILYVKPINYDTYCNTDVLYCNSRGFASIGFLASTPNNRLFHCILCEAMSSFTGQSYQDAGADSIYRLAGLGNNWHHQNRPGDFAIEKFKTKYPHLRFMGLDDSTIYPFAWNELVKMWATKEKLPEETTGVHWFGGGKKSQEMNSILTPETIKNYDSTLIRYIRSLV